MKKLKFESYSTDKEPTRAIIGIHGWKGNRFSFKSVASSLKIPNTEWFLPEAPYIIDNNETQRSWSFEIEPGVWERDEPKILMDNFLLKNVLNKYNSKNIFFIGFSQGALICYEYVLRSAKPWGGIFPIAGFMLDTDNISISRLHPNQKNTPILIGHGENDEIVKYESSKFAYKTLKNQGANVKLLSYAGKHKIGISYLKKIKSFIISTPLFE